MILVFVVAICLAASTIGGICGIGGGVLIKPLLDVTGVMSVSAVSFLSGLTVLAMAMISVFKNRKSKELDASRGLPLALGAALGGVIGKQLFESVKRAAGDDALVGAVQAIVLGVMVLGTLLYVRNKEKIKTKNIKNPLAGGGIGLALGVCSSFLGIGGGPMNLAVLSYCFSMDTKKAAINSILIILISQIASLIMSFATASVPSFDPWILAGMVGAGALGGYLSAKWRVKLSAKQTDTMFSILLCVILLICVFNAFRLLS